MAEQVRLMMWLLARKWREHPAMQHFVLFYAHNILANRSHEMTSVSMLCDSFCIGHLWLNRCDIWECLQMTLWYWDKQRCWCILCLYLLLDIAVCDQQAAPCTKYKHKYVYNINITWLVLTKLRRWHDIQLTLIKRTLKSSDIKNVKRYTNKHLHITHMLHLHVKYGCKGQCCADRSGACTISTWQVGACMKVWVYCQQHKQQLRAFSQVYGLSCRK